MRNSLKNSLIFSSFVFGLAASPLGFAQDAEPDIDPYESYEQIKALGEVDPAAIPAPVDNDVMPEAIVPEAVANEPSSISETLQVETLDTEIIDTVDTSPETLAQELPLDLAVITLDESDVETLGESSESLDSELPDTLDPDTLDNVTEDVALPSLEDKANATDAPRLARADILPFFLSAKEYLDVRNGEAAQTSLIYEVTTQPLDEEGQPAGEAKKPETVQLLIGPDYVAHQSDQPGSEFRLYDFKYNRLLRVVPMTEDGEPDILINVSLYALAHRNTRTVASMTDQGKHESVQIGTAQLDAFWMESAMSWTMNDRLGDMQTNQSDEGVEVMYKDAPVFSVEFDEAKYTSPAQSDALLVYAHHNWPVHPSALREFFAAPAPVKSMTIISKTPAAPFGAKQSWTLKTRADGQGGFPLPADAVNQAVTANADDPIGFVLNAAARGAALKGRPSKVGQAAAFEEALITDDLQKAWLIGRSYLARFGPCKEKTSDSVCKGLTDIEAREDLPETLEVLITAFKDAETAATRARALTALKPYANDPDAAPIILRTLGVTRAKLGNVTARATGLEALDAQSLMKAALVRDPYDPQTYLGLAQYKAAQGEFEAAWDIFDALRSSINTDAEMRFGVDKVEAGLVERAPGYFELPVMVRPDAQ